LAAADHEQVSLAARAGRLYSPTRSLPDKLDIPHPFGRTPRDRVRRMVNAYRAACELSAQTTVAVAAVAETVHAPSRLLSAARAAARAHSAGLQIDDMAAGCRGALDSGTFAEVADSPGHFERILSELGQADPIMLKRAAAIDRAGEQLMIESVQVAEL